MRIIAKRRLLAMAEVHGDCVDQVTRWYRTARAEEWQSLADVRKTYRDTDSVGDKTVFNIKGNDYRLIVHINYQTGVIYIKNLLTHAEYDRGEWKE
ncbi:MAG TPA: type II toxin-antitoxin system HigB family toxin [Chloroflexota bacterium]|nr:type II toxin-antitoxin system HigB family toxin [Chloroflexota bacterium]